MPKYLVLVPLLEEMSYAHDFTTQRGGECSQPFTEKMGKYAFTFPTSPTSECDIDFFVIGDAGNVRTAAITALTLTGENYEIIFLVGLGGGLKHSEMSLGDVLFSNRVKTFYPDKVARIRHDRKQLFLESASYPDRESIAKVFFQELVDQGAIPASVAESDKAALYVDSRKRVLESSYYRYRRDAIIWEDSVDIVRKYQTHLKGKFAANLLKSLVPVNTTTVPKLDPKFTNEHPAVKYGTIFSSEMVVDSIEFINFLLEKDTQEELDIYYQKFGRSHPRRDWFPGDIMAADMETYGFFSIARSLKGEMEKTACFSVRGISDLASDKAELDEDTEDKVREIAVKNCMAVVLNMICLFNPDFL